ncbi:MAG: pyridoxal phosphate-dependent aminotransferase [Bacillus sp. (in: firmicutes)]
MKTAWPEHGGKTSAIADVLREKGLQAKDVQDFSANINPLGIPAAMTEAMQAALKERSGCYPDLAYREHREKVARYEGVESGQVLLTNGGAEAIHLSAALFKGKKAALFAPSFSEYEAACKAHDVAYDVFLYEEVWDGCRLPANLEEILQAYDAIYVCRPNNPSGTCVSYEEMESLIALAKKHQTYVIVDEAFIHFAPYVHSAVPLISSGYVIVLRSLTKIFAVPGIRLGYMIAGPEVIERAASLQVPWSVNGVALSLIECLPKCEEFISRTVTYMIEEQEWLRAQYNILGLQMSRTCANFYLLRDPLLEDHEPLFLFLAGKGILARHTYNFEGLSGTALRLAVRTRKENEAAVHALTEWRERQ